PDSLELARAIRRLFGAEHPDLEAELDRVLPSQRLAWLARWWGARRAGLPDLDSLLRVMRANAASSVGYAPGAYPGVVRLLRPAPNGGGEHGTSSCLGWSSFTERPVEVHFVPGDHFSMLAEPNVGVLARQLENWLDLDS